MITIEYIMLRLNCSEQRAKLFFRWYGDDQERIERELAIQEYKLKNTPAIIENYIHVDDEEDIRNELDKNMKSDPSTFIESHNYTIGDYELEDVELKCR